MNVTASIPIRVAAVQRTPLTAARFSSSELISL
jgi:hypothetical protein